MVCTTDLRLLPTATATWILAVVGITAGAWRATAVGALVVGAVIAILAVPVMRGTARRLAAHLVLFALVGCLLLPALHRHDAAVAVFEQAEQESKVLHITATVTGEPRQHSRTELWATEQMMMPVRTMGGVMRSGSTTLHLPARLPVLVTVDAAALPRSFRDGDTVQLRGRARVDGSRIVLAARRITPLPDRGPLGALRDLRQHVRAVARRATEHLPGDEAALVRGMTTGDTHGLSARSEEIMQRGGITHLVAVSGANIALVVGAVLVPLLLLGVRRRPRILAAAAAMSVYVWLVGDEPSVQRAATMAAPMLAARFMGVRASPVAALAMTVAVWSVLDPVTSTSVGFLLSALATAAILIAAPPAARILVEMTGERISTSVALLVTVPLLAQAVCTPVLILLEPEISIWAVPVNIAVAPFIGPGTVLGLLGLAAGLAWLPAAQLLCTIAGGSSHLVLMIAGAADALPGSRIPVPAGATGALIAAVVILLAAGACVLRRLRMVRFAAAALLVAVLAPTLVGRLPGLGIPDWQVAACDVGQGDAVLVRPAGGGATVLIDTGPDPAALTACLHRLGVTRIDLLVLTHPHADHVGGAPALTGDLTPAEQWICPLEAARDASAIAAGPAPIPAVTGTAWSRDGVGISVLWPPSAEAAEQASRREQGNGEGDAANDCSVTVSVTWSSGARMIALGDLEPAAQRELSALQPGPADVVKVAHHGSRRQHAALYEQLAPRTALVTVGAENTFGHPTAAALDMLHGLGARVIRTDEHGTVVLDIDQGTARNVGGVH